MRTPTPRSPSDYVASYRLPTTVLPRAYRLTLIPDLTAATFTGEVEIDVTVGSPTPDVVLNAAELEITSADAHDGHGHDGRPPRRSSPPTRPRSG